jgi:hypothetical protein
MPVICIIQSDMEEAYTPLQITKKAWAIKRSLGGTFNYGGSVDDNTVSGGGQFSAQQSITPSLHVCASTPNFNGLAIGSSTVSPFLASNGDMSSVYGITDSGLLSATIANPTLVDNLSKTAPISSGGLVLPPVVEGSKIPPFSPSRIKGIVNYVNTPSQYDAAIASAAAANNVDPEEIKLKIAIESGGNPNAVSTSGAVGLGQFMPVTAAQYGITNRNDPTQSINGIAKFLAAHGNTIGNDPTAADLAYIGRGPTAQQYVANTRAARQTLQQNAPLSAQQQSSLQIATPINPDN